jgi:hypothetical protein
VFEDLPDIWGFDFSELGDGKVYFVFSDPRIADTDGDGLSDAEEADFGSRARSNETDGDGLDDLREAEIGTDPDNVDTDGDGRDDGYEDTHRDADYEPLVYTKEMSGWDYAGDFTLGAVCGELLGGLCERESVAWLAGNLAGGVFVVTDIRDAIGNVFQADFVGAGLNVFAAIPFAGDAASVVTQGVKFVRRAGDNAGPALRMMMKMDELPQWAKLDILDDVVEGGLGALRRSGLSDSAAVRFAAKGVDLRLLDDAVQGATRVTSGGGFQTWRGAETALRTATGTDDTGKTGAVPTARAALVSSASVAPRRTRSRSSAGRGNARTQYP